jgi:hypothetical protein
MIFSFSAKHKMACKSHLNTLAFSSMTFSTVAFDGNTYRMLESKPLIKFPPKYKTVKILFGD